MENVHGTEAVVVEIPAFAAARFFQLYKWDTRKLASIGKRPDFEKWLAGYLSGKASVQAEAYAEAQAMATIERLATQHAQENGITMLESFNALGLKPADAGYNDDGTKK